MPVGRWNEVSRSRCQVSGDLASRQVNESQKFSALWVGLQFLGRVVVIGGLDLQFYKAVVWVTKMLSPDSWRRADSSLRMYLLDTVNSQFEQPIRRDNLIRVEHVQLLL